jgi:hypothetical protein
LSVQRQLVKIHQSADRFAAQIHERLRLAAKPFACRFGRAMRA